MRSTFVLFFEVVVRARVCSGRWALALWHISESVIIGTLDFFPQI